MEQSASRSRGDIVTELTTAMKLCLENSGRKLEPLREDQCPLTTIKGFDSLCGIEVTVDLQTRLHIRLEDNVFVENNGGRSRARTVKQIVDAILRATRSRS